MNATSTPMKIDGRSDKQLAAAFEKKLDKIWRMGDRDECSIKHIWYTTILILAGGRYRADATEMLPIDYRTPGQPYPHDMSDEAWERRDAAAPAFYARQAPRLESVWDSIYHAAHEMGPERFVDVITQTKHIHSARHLAFWVKQHRHDSGDWAAFPVGSYDPAWMDATVAALDVLTGEGDDDE